MGEVLALGATPLRRLNADIFAISTLTLTASAPVCSTARTELALCQCGDGVDIYIYQAHNDSLRRRALPSALVSSLLHIDRSELAWMSMSRREELRAKGSGFWHSGPLLRVSPKLTAVPSPHWHWLDARYTARW